MAKNVVINGVTYADVPSVNIPISGSETGEEAKFVDTDSGTAVAKDLRDGKKAWVAGNEVTGTVPVKTADDVTANGKIVTVPAGIYDEQVQRSVATGSVTPNVAVVGSELGDDETEYPIELTPKASVGTSGYVSDIPDGAKVTKYIQVETKTVTPTTSEQTINPTSGKLIKSVNVHAVDMSASATEADVVKGKTFYSGSLGQRTGTATFPAVSQNTTSKILSIM